MLLTKLNDDKKAIWIVTVNCWTGEILDLEIKVIDKTLVIGDTGNGNGTVSISIYPKKSEYEECGFDKRKVINKIKDKHEEQIRHSIYSQNGIILYKNFEEICDREVNNENGVTDVCGEVKRGKR